MVPRRPVQLVLTRCLALAPTIPYTVTPAVNRARDLFDAGARRLAECVQHPDPATRARGRDLVLPVKEPLHTYGCNGDGEW